MNLFRRILWNTSVETLHFPNFFRAEMNESFLGGATGSVGALASETKESILDEELEKLNDMKFRLKDENARYLAKHEDFNDLLDEFVGEIFQHKPEDILGFGASFFNEKIKQSEAASALKAVKVKEKPQPDQIQEDQIQPKPNQPALRQPLVICGPSGAGKSELIRGLVESYPRFFTFSVSHTTRPPREGEEDGNLVYKFCSEEKMKNDIDQGRFFEHAFIRGAYYGTTYRAIEDAQANEKICLVDIDAQGVQNVRASDLSCRYLFVSPPSVEVLEENLRARSYETEESIDKKLGLARGEIAFGEENGNFDAVVVATSTDQCFDDAINLIAEWYPMINFDDEE